MIKIGVLDFFSGCGGVSTGIKNLNVPGTEIHLISGFDIDPYCCSTYEKMLNTPCEQIDISEIAQDKKLLKSKIKKWNLAQYDKIFLVGCAPCQGFAAHRKAIAGHDSRRSLFEDFCRVATAIKPDAIFMENVPDIFSAKYWPYFETGKKLLELEGYTVKSNIYNFATFGLPQERFRAIIISFRGDFDMPEGFLQPSEFKTVRQAIGCLPMLGSGDKCPNDPMHTVSRHRPETINILKQVPKDGGNRPIGVGPQCLDRARKAHGGFTDVYGRLAWDRPAVTITARCRTPSCGRFAHPELDRGLSIREAALLQGFPINFIFEGPFDDKYKQIGNAVPPLVAQHIAEHIIMLLIGKPNKSIRGDKSHTFEVSKHVGSGFAVTINAIKRKRTKNNDAT